MIRINRSPLPDGVTIAREEDYRGGVVFEMLIQDCHGKCYICEDSVHTAPNVEHRIPHRGDASLKYDWNNLFLACSHCNNTKLDKYDRIIDPTEVDPEKKIELSLDVDDDLREIVIVRKIEGNEDVDITVNLLDAVYNATKTDMKRYACQELKNKISNELLWFREKLDKYKTAPSDGNKAEIEQKLFRELSDESLFAAFKRGMVRADPELLGKFYCSLP